MSDDDVRLSSLPPREAPLEPMLSRRRGAGDESMQPMGVRGPTEKWDALLDLRVLRPRAIDLRALWRLTKEKEPPGIEATLGSRRPILLNHLLTPFPLDGNPPASVWGLGYEFVAHGIDAHAVSVAPDDQAIRIARVGQKVNLGLKLGGEVGIPDGVLSALDLGPSVPGV